MNYWPGLASNHNPSDLCLMSSYNYRCEPLAPAHPFLLLSSGIALGNPSYTLAVHTETLGQLKFFGHSSTIILG
jgi:hypothetical protein